MSAKPEARLSHYVNEMLKRVLCEPCWFTAIDCSGPMKSDNPHAGAMWMASRKYLGVKPSHLDWYLFQPNKNVIDNTTWYGPLGLYMQIELKVGKNKPSANQLATVEALRRQGIQSTICWSLPEVFTAINCCGFRLEANAEYVLKELMERYAAACREAER